MFIHRRWYDSYRSSRIAHGAMLLLSLLTVAALIAIGGAIALPGVPMP